MTDKNLSKFDNMSYEDALKKLTALIQELESGKLSFDDTLTAYKEAFEYYTFLSEYLGMAGEKIKEMNDKLSQKTSFMED